MVENAKLATQSATLPVAPDTVENLAGLQYHIRFFSETDVLSKSGVIQVNDASHGITGIYSPRQGDAKRLGHILNCLPDLTARLLGHHLRAIVPGPFPQEAAQKHVLGFVV